MNRERLDNTLNERLRPFNIAFLFPGQGLEAKDIVSFYSFLKRIRPSFVAERMQITQETMNVISPFANFQIEESLQDEKSPDYHSTAFIQPVVYTLSVLAYEIALEQHADLLSPSFAAGHSLGEYTALTASSVFDFEKGIEIVTYRGKVMQEASDVEGSHLVSIFGLSEDEVSEICIKTGSQIALINSPNLIVVGTKISMEALQDALGEKRARLSRLQTSGAFHTDFMQTAAKKLDQFLNKYHFADPLFPIVANSTGEFLSHGEEAKIELTSSMTRPVRWADTIQKMHDMGVEVFAELGPGSSLTALNERNGIEKDRTLDLQDFI